MGLRGRKGRGEWRHDIMERQNGKRSRKCVYLPSRHIALLAFFICFGSTHVNLCTCIIDLSPPTKHTDFMGRSHSPPCPAVPPLPPAPGPPTAQSPTSHAPAPSRPLPPPAPARARARTSQARPNFPRPPLRSAGAARGRCAGWGSQRSAPGSWRRLPGPGRGGRGPGRRCRGMGAGWG